MNPQHYITPGTPSFPYKETSETIRGLKGNEFPNGINVTETPMLTMSSTGTENKSARSSRIPIELVWKNVNVVSKSKTKPKTILHQASGIVKPGQFLAIIGASGAGKTTLLNYLSGKPLASDLKVEGEVLINGVNSKDSTTYLKFTTFVAQEDIFMETLTVQECLDYAAILKYSADPKRREERVLELLEELELISSKDLRFGGYPQKGKTLSRGERKKLSIAIALMTNPSLLFLDNPTTNLNAIEEDKIMQILHRLKLKGRTIIAAINQPSSHTYNCLDQLMIISLGKVVYHNAAKDAVSYFDTLGYHCPATKNPADYFMRLLNPDAYAENNQDERTYAEFIEDLSVDNPEKPKFVKVECDSNMPKLTKGFIYQKKYEAAWLTQFSTLLHRSIRSYSRLFMNEVIKTIAIIILGLFMIAARYEIEKQTYVGFMDRIGVIVLLASAMVVGGLSHCLLSIPEERAVLAREQACSLYDISAYFFAKVIGGMLFSLHQPIILLFMVYWLVPLAASPGAFFLQLLTLFLAYQTGAAFSLLVGAFITDRESLISITPLLLYPLLMLSGLAVSLNLNETVPVIWPFQWISCLKYVCNIMLRAEFELNDEINYVFSVDDRVIITESELLLELIGVDLSFGVAFVCLIALYVVFLIIGLLGLKFTIRRF